MYKWMVEMVKLNPRPGDILIVKVSHEASKEAIEVLAAMMEIEGFAERMKHIHLLVVPLEWDITLSSDTDLLSAVVKNKYNCCRGEA